MSIRLPQNYPVSTKKTLQGLHLPLAIEHVVSLPPAVGFMKMNLSPAIAQD